MKINLFSFHHSFLFYLSIDKITLYNNNNIIIMLQVIFSR